MEEDGTSVWVFESKKVGGEGDVCSASVCLDYVG